MKTKMLFFSGIAAIMLSAPAWSQSKLTYGIRAGVNFQNLNGKDSDGDNLNNDLKTGFNAGVNAESTCWYRFLSSARVIVQHQRSKI